MGEFAERVYKLCKKVPKGKKITGLERRVKKLESNLTDREALIALQRGALVRASTVHLLKEDILSRIQDPIVVLDSFNRIAGVSAGFTELTGYTNIDVEVALPGQPGFRRGVRFNRIIQDQDVFARYEQLLDIFYPETQQHHFEALFRLVPKDQEQGGLYSANLTIANQLVDTKGGPETAYHGTTIEFGEPPGLKEKVSSLLGFFKSTMAHATAFEYVTKEIAEQLLKEVFSKGLKSGHNELDSHPILVDFSPTREITPEAAKTFVGVYYSLRRTGHEKKYLVPGNLRGVLFDAGLPAPAMMIPEKAKERYEKGTLPGAVAQPT